MDIGALLHDQTINLDIEFYIQTAATIRNTTE